MWRVGEVKEQQTELKEKGGESERCSTKKEVERNSKGGKGRRMNKKINI